MRRLIIVLTLIPAIFIFSSLEVQAEENNPLLSELAALENLKARLEEASRTLPQEDSKSMDSVAQALARIEATKKFLTKKPKSKKARDMLAACSLLTDTAILQVKTKINEYRILELQKQRESVHQELKSTFEKIKQTQEKISRIERGHVSKFRDDLAKERRKAEEQWEEAKLRFSELQSELIQVQNEARRTVITVSDLLFGFDKYDLTSELKISLARIAGILSVFRELNIRVEGHTDNRGTKEYNQELSEKRAHNVMDFLIAQGINPARLTAAGYYFSRPVTSNDTPEGRQKNRRVELVIQENKQK